jgi:hypothetical protein
MTPELITHRPQLYGPRALAAELAYIFDVEDNLEVDEELTASMELVED